MAAANARAGLTGIGDFLYKLQVQRPLVKAETAEASERAETMKQAREQQKRLYELWTQPMAQWKHNFLTGSGGGGAGGDQAMDPGYRSSVNEAGMQFDVQPKVSRPAVQATDVPSGHSPSFSDIRQGLPPVSLAGNQVGAPRGGVGVQMTMGKSGEPEFLPGALGGWRFAFDSDPANAFALADPKTREVLKEYAASNAAALSNRKSAADLEQSMLTAAYGNPEERKAHSEFTRNAAQLSRRLAEYTQTVKSVGNWEWQNQKGAAMLSSLPLDIADNWTKITNPGGVLREGLVSLGKEAQIPSANDHWYGKVWGPRNGTTLAAIDQTQNVLADYIRQYENLDFTKAPVIGLTPEVRALVGATRASKMYEAQFGRPVPTEETQPVQGLPGVSVAPPVHAPGDGSVPGSTPGVPEVRTWEDYKKLGPNQPYTYNGQPHKTPSSHRSSPNLGSTAGAPSH